MLCMPAVTSSAVKGAVAHVVSVTGCKRSFVVQSWSVQVHETVVHGWSFVFSALACTLHVRGNSCMRLT